MTAIGSKECPNSMDTITQTQNIGIDVSRDWLDIYYLPDGNVLRLPSTDQGHACLAELACKSAALVCFEATGGQEWRLWANLDAVGVQTWQLPPAHIKASAASRGTHQQSAPANVHFTTAIDSTTRGKPIVIIPRFGSMFVSSPDIATIQHMTKCHLYLRQIGR